MRRSPLRRCAPTAAPAAPPSSPTTTTSSPRSALPSLIRTYKPAPAFYALLGVCFVCVLSTAFLRAFSVRLFAAVRSPSDVVNAALSVLVALSCMRSAAEVDAVSVRVLG